MSKINFRKTALKKDGAFKPAKAGCKIDMPTSTGGKKPKPLKVKK